MDQQTISRAASETSPAVSSGRSIRLFLADGTPQGLIVAEVMNWTGQALSAPRARLADLLRRPEAARTGVYILLGPDPDRPAGTKAYVGEADNIAKRLRRHVGDEDKDFFDRLVIIVAKDDNLTKAHARFLESRLARMAKEAGAVALANNTQPDFQLLPEADRADMEFFLGQLRLVLPILSFDLFRRPVTQTAGDVGGGDAVFMFSTAGATATARESDDGFVVLAGSTARRIGTETFPAGYQALRDQLVQDGRLVDGPSPEFFVFTLDVAFASPSAAASIVAARSASGPREWRLRGSGQSYRDWRAMGLGEG
jgi:hypothetical protein